jgi:hypothetical protein
MKALKMLQTVHQNGCAPRASSIYCRWIRETRRPGAPLIGVWIDSEMRCFEHQSVPEAQSEPQHDALADPGGVATVSSRWANH